MSAAADIAAAVRLLTVVPVGRAEGKRPVRYFTYVGLAYSAVALAIAWGATRVMGAAGSGSLLTAVLIVAASGALSGFLHWDGLADCADAIGVRGDAPRRLAVMRDSTVGAFGVVAIVFVALLQVAAVAAIVESGSWWALGAAPVLGRWGAALALLYRTPARPDGLAARYAHRDSALGLVVLCLPLLALMAVPVPPTPVRVALLIAGAVAAWLVPRPFARCLGGITGDVLGATIVLTETFVLVAAAVVGGSA